MDNNPHLPKKLLVSPNIAGERASEFEVVVTPSHRGPGGRLLASLVSLAGGGVRVEASSGVGVAWALHHYLKYHALCHVSWQTSQLSLPAQLPHVNKTLEAVDLFRYLIYFKSHQFNGKSLHTVSIIPMPKVLHIIVRNLRQIVQVEHPI